MYAAHALSWFGAALAIRLRFSGFEALRAAGGAVVGVCILAADASVVLELLKWIDVSLQRERFFTWRAGGRALEDDTNKRDTQVHEQRGVMSKA